MSCEHSWTAEQANRGVQARAGRHGRAPVQVVQRQQQLPCHALHLRHRQRATLRLTADALLLLAALWQGPMHRATLRLHALRLPATLLSQRPPKQQGLQGDGQAFQDEALHLHTVASSTRRCVMVQRGWEGVARRVSVGDGVVGGVLCTNRCRATAAMCAPMQGSARVTRCSTRMEQGWHKGGTAEHSEGCERQGDAEPGLPCSNAGCTFSAAAPTPEAAAAAAPAPVLYILGRGWSK